MATNVKHLIIIHSRSRRPKPSHKTPQNQCPGENRGYTCKSWVPAFPRCSWQALNRAHALSRGIHREHVHSTSCMPRARSLSCSGGEGTSAEEEGTTAEEDEEEADSAGGGTGAPFQAPRKLLARMSQHRCAFTKKLVRTTRRVRVVYRQSAPPQTFLCAVPEGDQKATSLEMRGCHKPVEG